MKSLVIAVPVLCLVAAAGCNRDRDRDRGTVDLNRPGETVESAGRDLDRSGTTTVTGANVNFVPNESAIDRIVAARCAREATCNNIGTDKDFTTREACSQKLRGDMRDDLGAKECPHGVDQKELNECLESIQKEDCNNPIDMIGRLAACRTSDLCQSTDMRNR
jgi:hypothetical protein